MVRRSLIAAALSLACALLQGGCSLPRTDSAIEHELSSELLRRLSEDDVAGVETMFCKTSRARPELRGEIERGMAFFEGRVETGEGGWSTSSSGDEYVEYGKTLRRSVNPWIENIRTDAGKRYEIHICYYETYVGHEDLEGVSEIDIWEVLRDGTRGEKCVIGQYLDPSRPPEPREEDTTRHDWDPTQDTGEREGTRSASLSDQQITEPCADHGVVL